MRKRERKLGRTKEKGERKKDSVRDRVRKTEGRKKWKDTMNTGRERGRDSAPS